MELAPAPAHNDASADVEDCLSNTAVAATVVLMGGCVALVVERTVDEIWDCPALDDCGAPGTIFGAHVVQSELFGALLSALK